MNPMNLFTGIPRNLPQELVEILWKTDRVRIERIVSRQHITPAGEWYDQTSDEWVLVVVGSAGLRIEGTDEINAMKPGDVILLPAGKKHRVDWTDPSCDTIWLAIHVERASPG